MRSLLEAGLGDYQLYAPRREEFDTGRKIPFHVSPKPFTLNPDQSQEIQEMGNEIVNYFTSVDALYRTDGTVRKLLDTGKPEIFLTEAQRPSNYLFVRPDLIVSENGFTICEIETSPFGLALAELLNRGYNAAGYDTLVGENELSDHVSVETPQVGTIVYSQKTKSYHGQMTFLADKVFSNNNRTWAARSIDDLDSSETKSVYRGFYLSECMSDPAIAELLKNQHPTSTAFTPSLTPHLEEKAGLSLIWDKRFESYFRTKLGSNAFEHLRKLIPPTWIVGQEEYFSPGLPGGISNSVELASLSKAKRAFVIKPSGFASNASWAEGVSMLHKKSAKKAEEILVDAANDKSGLHIVQEFRSGIKYELNYSDDGQQTMMAKIRLTPYFAATGEKAGKLIAIKATGCENTDLIHGTSASINTAVS